MMAQHGQKADREQISEQLEAIKRLLAAILIKEGMTQAELAKVLQISQPTVSRMFPGLWNLSKRSE